MKNAVLDDPLTDDDLCIMFKVDDIKELKMNDVEKVLEFIYEYGEAKDIEF